MPPLTVRRRIGRLSGPSIEMRLYKALLNRRLPDYALYADPEGANDWLALSAAPEFAVARELTRLLYDHLPKLIPHLPQDLHLVSVGPGDGEKERLLLEAALPRPMRYLAVDTNPTLIEAALATVADLPLKESWGLVGLCEDLPKILARTDSPRLLCLLGNTFCNFEPEGLLRTLALGMQPGDLFLVDADLRPADGDEEAWRRRVAAAYGCERNRRFNLGPVLRRGADENACTFQIRLRCHTEPDGPLYRTEKRLFFHRRTSLRCGRHRVEIAAGDVLDMGFTWKPTARQMLSRLHWAGLMPVVTAQDPDGSRLLALCRLSDRRIA